MAAVQQPGMQQSANSQGNTTAAAAMANSILPNGMTKESVQALYKVWA